MCGITGIVHANGHPAELAVLRRMTDVLAHRGPNDEGHWTAGPVGLGHRRLSIIDLSAAGRQPMMTADGRYVMSYNGEIYNYAELRAELAAQGYTFNTQTDSEVLLNGFAQWGLKVLDRLNGMFAFAIWDTQADTLTLARDRYGIKPLYYTESNGVFLFGSEIKAILEHEAYQREVDAEGLLEYFTFQNFFSQRTLFKDVKLLPAGSYMQVALTRKGLETERVRYWDYNFVEPESPRADEDYLEELDFLFQQAVSRQLVSDVDVGTYLSGGMDSGSIAAVAAKQLPYIRSFTCGFDLSSASGVEMAFDERAEAERMSYAFKTEHYEMVLKAGDMERCLPKLAYHLEEPRVGQSYPNFYAAHLASKFNRVVLSGAGGDELFGGYPWRYYRAVKSQGFEHYVDIYYDYWQRLLTNGDVKNVFAPVWDQVSQVDTRDIFRRVFKVHEEQLGRPEDYINHSLYLEANTFLHGLLVVEDKLSMAHSLETRVPFLDNDLVDFAMQLPTHLKIANLQEVVKLDENEVGIKTSKYFQKTNDGKLLLRKMMSRHVPQEVVEREKQGFSAPDASWFKGESIEYVKSKLMGDGARIYDYLDRGAVQGLVNQHLEGKENKRLLIWSLLNVECFLERYFA